MTTELVRAPTFSFSDRIIKCEKELIDDNMAPFDSRDLKQEMALSFRSIEEMNRRTVFLSAQPRSASAPPEEKRSQPRLLLQPCHHHQLHDDNNKDKHHAIPSMTTERVDVLVLLNGIRSQAEPNNPETYSSNSNPEVMSSLSPRAFATSTEYLALALEKEENVRFARDAQAVIRRRSEEEEWESRFSTSVRVVRPNPVKTTPPSSSSGGQQSASQYPRASLSGVAVVSATAVSNQPPSEGSTYRGLQRKNKSDEGSLERRAAVRVSEEPEQGLFKRPTRAESERKRQELQCNFPENESSVMPPMSRRDSEDGEEDAPMEGYRMEFNNQTRTTNGNIRIGSGSSSLGGTRNLRTATSRENEDEIVGQASVQPTPLFERLVTEEVQELKAYARIIENQSRRLQELERVHGDLEVRLEVESRSRQLLEETLEAREREWNKKLQLLEFDRDHWKEVVQAEQLKNSRLIDQVVRKEQDIHRMLQRKYDQEGTTGSRSVRNNRASHHNTSERGSGPAAGKSPESRLEFKSPHEILKMKGSVEKARLRNVKGLLNDFFGL